MSSRASSTSSSTRSPPSPTRRTASCAFRVSDAAHLPTGHPLVANGRSRRARPIPADLEIYNEEVKDLLRPRTPSKEIAIREDAAGGIFVLGVHERVVHTREELFASLAAGSNCRATGATLMNAVSSRSHSLFTVIVEQRPRTPGEDRTCAKLHLVDLAGSERAKKTGAEGKRFKESVTINQGLLALGNVIAALCEDSRPGKRKESVQHVPYRESKLTRLLQDSLGGNTQTLMVACGTPRARTPRPPRPPPRT